MRLKLMKKNKKKYNKNNNKGCLNFKSKMSLRDNSQNFRECNIK